MLQLPFFGKKQKDDSRFLVATINADHVKVLAMFKDTNTLKIIGTGVAKMDPGKVRSGAIIFSDQVAEAVDEAVTKATEGMGTDIADIIFGVSGDLCIGFMTTIKVKRNKSTPISPSDIEQIYDKIDEVAEIQAQNELNQINGNAEIELERILRTDLYVKADGEDVVSLLNKSPTGIEIATFNFYVPTYHLNALQEVSKKCGLNLNQVAPEMYCLAKALETEFKNQVLIEIDGDYTHAAVVFSGGIVATRTLNIGLRHFIEGISSRMGLTMLEAARMLKTYLSEKLTPSEANIVRNSLKDPIDIWRTGIELLFLEFSGVKTFPSQISITGEGAELADVWTALSENEMSWTKSIPFKNSPVFKKININDIPGVTDATGKVNGIDWVPTISISLIRADD